MRLSTRFAATGAVMALAVGGLLSVPAHASSPAPADREYGLTPTDREYGIQPGDLTAQSSGKQYCWETGYAECKARKNLYDYLGCTTSSIYPYPWYPNSYYFYYWC